MIRVIKEKKLWDDRIRAFAHYDVYHTYDYHHNSIKPEDEPVLLYYDQDGLIISFPLIIRKIPNTSYYDATSAYGYTGPLVEGNIHAANLLNWHYYLELFFKERAIVSVFSSLNPFIENQSLALTQLGQIERHGEIVYLDLEQSESDQWAAMSKTTRRYIGRNKDLFDIREGNTDRDTELFYRIYTKSMDRLNASSQYYFSLSYFKNLLRNDSFKGTFIFAISKETGKEVAGGLFFHTNKNIIQYHLSGTEDAFRYYSPIRSILNHVRKKGSKDGYKYFNLGGGVDSKQDSLFKFKMSYSNFNTPFEVWKYIVNEDVYNELCLKNGTLINLERPNFFPKYRNLLK